MWISITSNVLYLPFFVEQRPRNPVIEEYGLIVDSFQLLPASCHVIYFLIII